MTDRKRIAIVCPHAGGGGSVARVANQHAKGLSSYFDVTLLSNNHDYETLGDFRREVVPAPKLGYLRRLSHVLGDFLLSKNIGNVLQSLHRNRPIDFVLCHSHALAAIAARPLQNNSAVPFGVVVHGDIFERPAGTYDHLLTGYYKAVTPVAYDHASLIICLSPSMRDHLRDRGCRDECLAVIANGVAEEELCTVGARSDRAQNNEKLRLLYVGRISIEKGLDVLLNACADLQRRAVTFELTIIGDGPQLPECRSISKQLGIEASVNWLGRINRTQICDYYINADILCVPSLNDPLPTVILEAMTCKLLVVGSNVDGIPFLIDHGHTGYTFQTGSPMALSKTLIALSAIKGHSKWQAVIDSAYATVKKQFSWPLVTRSLKEHIEEVLARNEVINT